MQKTLLEIFLDLASKRENREEKVAPKVGDKVVIGEREAAYLTDVSTDKQVFVDFEGPGSHLHNYFATSEAIVKEVLQEKRPYKCGHCETTHYHTCIIYFPQLDKKYYADWTRFQ